MEKQEDAHKQQARFWLGYSHQLATAIRYVEALAAAERALKLDETSAEAYYVRGTCLAMLARYDEALHDFERALRLDKNPSTANLISPNRGRDQHQRVRD
jgi:tetratricopeptide (TPR) repeat protein